MSSLPEDSTHEHLLDAPTVRLDGGTLAHLTPGAILGNRYRIVSLVGRGGMGSVYRADDLRLGQTIALKFLAQGAGHAGELLDEVRIGRQIAHPNICRLYDVAEVDGRLFITMEYVDGEDLASLLRRVGWLTASKAMGVARDLCAGLAAAHELGVIHRDMKPGNVMLDGRGRARITDFGLAIAEANARASIAAGTPAYMAPEQLRGEKATTRSDIYALGLVLYEVFTGRPAIAGGTLTEILEQQHHRRFPLPSELVPDIDPAIERMILRCLDPDPESRPESVASMIRSLPDFDPLRAAVAAGETPTPAMVAAAVRKGDLEPRTALTMLATAIGLSVLVAALAMRTTIIGKTPPKSPEVLEERAGEILETAGAAVPTVDHGSRFFFDRASRRLHFVDRRSPVPMLPQNTERLIDTDDPPFNVAGMTLVSLDEKGRLLEMAIVPPSSAAARTPAAVPIENLLRFTGIDAATLRSVPPTMTAPVDTDEKRAWVAADGRRIEVASYLGRPVWLAVIGDPDAEHRVSSSRMTSRIAIGSFVFVLILVPASVIVLAWNNFRRRTGDRKGALRIAALVFIVFAVAFFLRAHHSGSLLYEWLMMSTGIAYSTFLGLMLGLFYFSTEPLVRRRWPETLISWSRLLARQWGDSMIGRDVLVGCIVGTSIIFAGELVVEGASLLNMEAALAPTPSPLSSIWQTAYTFLRAFGEAVSRGLTIIALLLIVRSVVRRDRVAIAVVAVFVAATFIDDIVGPLGVSLLYGAIVGAIVSVVAYRFGVVTIISAAFVAITLRRVPLTLDPSSWYFGRSLVVLALIAGLALYGFSTSTAGRRVLRPLQSPLP